METGVRHEDEDARLWQSKFSGDIFCTSERRFHTAAIVASLLAGGVSVRGWSRLTIALDIKRIDKCQSRVENDRPEISRLDDIRKSPLFQTSLSLFFFCLKYANLLLRK
jgi:hypothetical protein